jgi:hypothetical protein
MRFKTLALAATLLAALAAPVTAQVKEHVFKVGIGLSDDHPRPWRSSTLPSNWRPGAAASWWLACSPAARWATMSA